MAERRPTRVALKSSLSGRGRSPLSPYGLATPVDSPVGAVTQGVGAVSPLSSGPGDPSLGNDSLGGRARLKADPSLHGVEVDIKIVCVGAANTGKTTFLKNWETGEFVSHVPTTIQMEFHRKETVVTLPPKGFEVPFSRSQGEGCFLSSFLSSRSTKLDPRLRVAEPSHSSASVPVASSLHAESHSARQTGQQKCGSIQSNISETLQPAKVTECSVSGDTNGTVEYPTRPVSTESPKDLSATGRSDGATEAAKEKRSARFPEVVLSSYEECEAVAVGDNGEAEELSKGTASSASQMISTVLAPSSVCVASNGALTVAKNGVIPPSEVDHTSICTFADLRCAMADADSTISPSAFAALERRRATERVVNKDYNPRRYAQYAFSIPALPSYWYEPDSAAAAVALGARPSPLLLQRGNRSLEGTSFLSSPSTLARPGVGQKVQSLQPQGLRGQQKKNSMFNLRFFNSFGGTGASSRSMTGENSSDCGGFEDHVVCGEKRPAIVKMWDIQGQEGTKSMTRIFYTGAMGALIFCELTASMESITSALSWKNDVARKVFVQRNRKPNGRTIATGGNRRASGQRAGGEKANYAGTETVDDGEDESPPCWLVVNKYDIIRDLPEPLPQWATHDALDALCKQHGFAGWTYCAGRRGLNVEETVEALLATVTERFPDELRYQQGCGREREANGSNGTQPRGGGTVGLGSGGPTMIRRTRIRQKKSEGRCCN